VIIVILRWDQSHQPTVRPAVMAAKPMPGIKIDCFGH